MTTTTDRIVENKMLLAVGRVAQVLMVPLLSIAIAVSGNYFTTQTNATEKLSTRVSALEAGAAEDRQAVAIITTRINTGQAQREAFQDQTLARLDRMQDSIVELSNAVAALTAVLEREQR